MAELIGSPVTRTGADAAGKLTTDETINNAAVILFGGIETVEGAVTTLLWHLLSDPLRCDTVHADHGLLDAAVEESLRLEPAASRVDRYATRDIDMAGATIRAATSSSCRSRRREP